MGVVKADYVSDHTLWMREQLAKNPDWVKAQEEGRALWWDKKQESVETAGFSEAEVPQKAYPYDVNF